jgi:hypothetical protein
VVGQRRRRPEKACAGPASCLPPQYLSRSFRID